MNVNDSAQAPGNDPVANVNFNVTLQHGLFKSLPDLCKTSGVTPPSSLSADNRTLVCNLGTQLEGTAHAVQAAIVVDGTTGEEVSATGTIAGKTATIPPIPITNGFGMDMEWGTPTSYWFGGPGLDADYGFDLEWTLRALSGSDPGPQTITYNLTITTQNGAPIVAGTRLHSECMPYSIGNTAPGHPWSGGDHPADQMAPFVETCTLTQTGPTTFQLTLSGIDYSMLKAPTKDSAGNSLGTTWTSIASGSIWLTLQDMPSQTSVSLQSTAPIYTSTTGATYTDVASNNTSTKAINPSGNWAAAWYRGFTGSAGSNWDNTYRVAQGTLVQSSTGNRYGEVASVPGTAILGECQILDPAYVTYDSHTANRLDSDNGARTPLTGHTTVVLRGQQSLPGPDQRFVRSEPVRLRRRHRLDHDAAGGQGAGEGGPGHFPQVPGERLRRSSVREPDDQDHRTGGARRLDVGFNASGLAEQHLDQPRAQHHAWLPGGIHSCARRPVSLHHRCSRRASRDQPEADGQQVGQPGQGAAGRSCHLHARLLPGGRAAVSAGRRAHAGRHVATRPDFCGGSATPAPTVTTNGAGQEVATWQLDDVPSNSLQTLRYQAVAGGSVSPCKLLTNTVRATYGEESAVASAQVTVACSGSTSILKTPDSQFIPDPDGNGSGSGSWTVTLRSSDPMPQAFTDTIDILPYEGDSRGSSYSGSYTVGSVTAESGATVYYTTARPATLSDDPANPTNGSAGVVTGNTVGWTTTYTADATAIRVIGPELPPGGTQQFKVPITTTDALGDDLYVNRAQGRAGHTRLVMRTSAPVTMASSHSMSLKKYVQDPDGSWHDANGDADAPTFQIGDAVRYRIVVNNTGRNTLSDIDVKDDKFPELGNFHIDTLAPGASKSREFSTKIDPSSGDKLTNTACATAGPLVAESCDPAIRFISRYVTVKTSDPQNGSAVQPGDKVTYTVTVTQVGQRPAAAKFSDDMTNVLDDATYNRDVKASLGKATVKDGFIVWSGTLPVGGKAVITYSMTVKDMQDLSKDSNFTLKNVVHSPGCRVDSARTSGSAVRAAAAEPGCTTSHDLGRYQYSKTSDPESASTVRVGDTVTYTLQVKQIGKGRVDNAKVIDNLSGALDDADYNGGAKASSGTVQVNDETLTWTGDLPVGQKVTITYSVKVTAGGDHRLANVVTSPGKRGTCDKAVGCQTEHVVASAGSLPSTGSNAKLQLILAGVLLVTGGGVLLLVGLRQRRRKTIG